MLGELTGALAHELSQPVTAVLSNAQAARAFVDREPIDVPELRAIIDDIINDNRRAGAVIYWLRGFLRKQASVLQPVSLNDVVREVVDLAHSEIVTRSVTVTSTLAAGTSSVLGDRVQLQQVVLNLLLNACDAMRETPLSPKAPRAHDRGRGWIRSASGGGSRHGHTGKPARSRVRAIRHFSRARDSALGLRSAARS